MILEGKARSQIDVIYDVRKLIVILERALCFGFNRTVV